MLEFLVEGQILQRVDQTDDFSSAVFKFDSTWEFLNRSALFVREEKSIPVLLMGDTCSVPWEVLDGGGYFEVSVFGGSDRSTNTVLVMVPQRTALENTTPPEPAPGYFDAVVTKVLDAAEDARLAKNAAQAAGTGAKEALTHVEELAGEVASARQTVISCVTAASASEAAAAQSAMDAKRFSEVAQTNGNMCLRYQTRFEFPSIPAVAQENSLFVAEAEHRIYRWIKNEFRYAVFGSDYEEIKTIDGGKANE